MAAEPVYGHPDLLHCLYRADLLPNPKLRPIHWRTLVKVLTYSSGGAGGAGPVWDRSRERWVVFVRLSSYPELRAYERPEYVAVEYLAVAGVFELERGRDGDPHGGTVVLYHR